MILDRIAVRLVRGGITRMRGGDPDVGVFDSFDQSVLPACAGVILA